MIWFKKKEDGQCPCDEVEKLKQQVDDLQSRTTFIDRISMDQIKGVLRVRRNWLRKSSKLVVSHECNEYMRSTKSDCWNSICDEVKVPQILGLKIYVKEDISGWYVE